MQIKDDDIILDRVLNGEHQLFNIIIEKHKNYAFTIALNILNNREDAEEAAHDSFIKAYQNLASFKKEAKFSSWLYRIVFNTSLNYKKKKGLPQEDIDTATHVYDHNTKPPLESEDQKKLIGQALNKLSDIDKSIISLFYLKEFSLEEIAEITDLSISNIKVKLHRGRKRLAAAMKNILKGEIVNL